MTGNIYYDSKKYSLLYDKRSELMYVCSLFEKELLEIENKSNHLKMVVCLIKKEYERMQAELTALEKKYNKKRD